MSSITKFLNSRTQSKEQGFSLIELLVIILILGILSAVAIPVFKAQKEKALEMQENTKSCGGHSDITEELVKYVEEYNVNHPNDAMGDFTVSDSETYESETHQQQVNDPKFSLLVSKVTCIPYKFDSIDGGHFVIETGKPITNSKSSSSQEEWTKVYDSREH